MDPRNPDVIYAATHQRFRNVAALINGGPEIGHPQVDRRRQDLARAGERPSGKKTWARSAWPSRRRDPDVIYATIELAHREGGFYRSTNGGESWEKRSDYVSGGTGPHYYQEIFASPHKFDRVYQMDVRMHVTEDGGKTFRPVGEKFKHVRQPRAGLRSRTTRTTCSPAATGASTRAGTSARPGSSSPTSP